VSGARAPLSETSGRARNAVFAISLCCPIIALAKSSSMSSADFLRRNGEEFPLPAEQMRRLDVQLALLVAALMTMSVRTAVER